MFRLHRGTQPLEESEAFWQGEIDSGRLLLARRGAYQGDPAKEWSPVRPEQTVSSGDKVLIRYHKHERAVLAVRPSVLLETPDLVVLDKPAGLQCSTDIDEVNGLRVIASEALAMTSLQLSTRLDQGVTGCLLLGRSKKKAMQARTALHEDASRKIYLARVDGELPAELRAVDSSRAIWVAADLCPRAAEDLAALAGRPSLIIDAPLGFRTAENAAFVDKVAGKPCRTVVTWLKSFSDGTHLVHCRLHAGLKHQIRCHLASVGLPIANDATYGGQCSSTSDLPIPPPFLGVEAELASTFGPESTSFREWCPKCCWTAEVMAGKRTPPDATSAAVSEIWLRCWRCSVPSFSLDVAAPLPVWAFD